MTPANDAPPPSCPSCARPLPADAPAGQCPACLLRAGLPTPGAPVGDAPDLDAVRAALPQFEVLEVLGRGGMGVVWRARQRSLDRVVALKVLPRGVGTEHGFADRFAREARALARLQHPGIVQIHDFGQAEGFFWLAMEFVDGITLRAAMRERRLSPKEALAIVPQICDALQSAHDQGVVHRDIKPENVLLDRQGRVKIADFGLAKLLDRAPSDPTLTRADHVMGTPHYMAPEQVEHPTEVDHRADIYSLGVVFYEMLTGELPLGRFAAPSTKFAMDVRLDEIVLRALEKEPERRWQHASEVRTHVTEVAEGPAAPARPIRPESPAPPAPEEPPKLLRLAVAGCAVVVGSSLAMAASLFRGGPSMPGVVFAGMACVVGWFACLVAAIRIHHAKGRLRGVAFAAVGLLLPLLAAFVVPMSLTVGSGLQERRLRATAAEHLREVERRMTTDRETRSVPPVGVAPTVVLRSKGDIANEHLRSYEEIKALWEELRANHASLDVDGALRFYVPDAAEFVRTQIPKRDVRDGSCGIPLASEAALRGRLSTLALRTVELDESGSFATCEASDGVRCVTFRMTRWRTRADRPGAADRDPAAFRWSFTADPIEVH